MSELLAGLLPGATSLVAAVGQWLIDHQPPGAKDIAVSLFGTNDKLAFELIIVAISLVIGAGLGLLARRRFEIAAVVFVLFGVIGFFASLDDPLASSGVAAASAAISVGVGLWVLSWLLDGSARRVATGRRGATMPDWSRRSFMIRAGSVGVAAVAAGYLGRSLLDRQRVAPVSSGPPIPPASVTVPALDATEDLSTTIPDLTPIVMPNDRFYRIDTALLTPVVDTDGWTLKIHGLVDRETTLTWEQLIALPMFEQYVTISCVSNEVGGTLVGNAKWTGVRLRDVLDMAGVQTAATQLVGRSVDGFTAGMPTAWVMDTAREPMIALKMNDVQLPPNHGYPARLIVPGLYGYVSATKWLAELELTTLESFDGYWVPLGWSKEAPDPDAVADRYAAQRRPGRPGPYRRDRLGTGPRHLPGRGVGRRPVAGCPAVHPDLERDLGPVGVRLGRAAGRPQDPGPRHRRHGRRPARAAVAARARWCARLAHRQRVGQLTLPGGTDPRRSDRSGPWLAGDARLVRQQALGVCDRSVNGHLRHRVVHATQPIQRPKLDQPLEELSPLVPGHLVHRPSFSSDRRGCGRYPHAGRKGAHRTSSVRCIRRRGSALFRGRGGLTADTRGIGIESRHGTTPLPVRPARAFRGRNGRSPG